MERDIIHLLGRTNPLNPSSALSFCNWKVNFSKHRALFTLFKKRSNTTAGRKGSEIAVDSVWIKGEEQTLFVLKQGSYVIDGRKKNWCLFFFKKKKILSISLDTWTVLVYPTSRTIIVKCSKSVSFPHTINTLHTDASFLCMCVSVYKSIKSMRCITITFFRYVISIIPFMIGYSSLYFSFRDEA